ncbi:hypothetical protein C8J57DRAFT_1474132 [Mycena rebaudengoi]|nr:hypothetical protein C8J57DRAFT_1474132 [Mycena rebaudengoi]
MTAAHSMRISNVGCNATPDLLWSEGAVPLYPDQKSGVGVKTARGRGEITPRPHQRDDQSRHRVQVTSVESTVHGTGAEVPARERAVSNQEMNGSLELHRACVKSMLASKLMPGRPTAQGKRDGPPLLVPRMKIAGARKKEQERQKSARVAAVPACKKNTTPNCTCKNKPTVQRIHRPNDPQGNQWQAAHLAEATRGIGTARPSPDQGPKDKSCGEGTEYQENRKKPTSASNTSPDSRGFGWAVQRKVEWEDEKGKEKGRVGVNGKEKDMRGTGYSASIWKGR